MRIGGNVEGTESGGGRGLREGREGDDEETSGVAAGV